MNGNKLTEDEVKAVVRLFPDHTKDELVEMLNISSSTIDRIQKRYGLRKSPEHLHKIGARAGKVSYNARGGKFFGNQTPEAIARRVSTYKKRYKTEEIRVKWGLKQETKIRLRHGCKEMHDQCHYLRKLGYIIDKPRKVAYYTPETRRATRLERMKLGEKKGSFHCYFNFEPYRDETN